MPGSIDGVLGHGSKVHRGEGRCHMEDENSVDVRVVQHRLGHGSEVHKGGGRWHVEDVNSVDARVVEQAIICWGHFGSRYKSGCGFDPAIHSFLPPTTLGEQSLCYCRHKAVSMCDTKPTTGLSHLGGGL